MSLAKLDRVRRYLTVQRSLAADILDPLLARGYQVHCGFDNHEPGESASRQMITRHRSIKRLRPPAHDWNDALRVSG